MSPASAAGPETPAAGRPAPPPWARDPYFDNAKFLAVVLVVVGHAWGPLQGMRLVDTAHLVVYSFHMPLFVLIAGYFSRAFATTDGKVRRLAGLAVTYLIFEAAYPLFVDLIGGRRYEWSPLSPYYLTWFLLALVVWRLSAPLWQQLRRPLLVAVIVSLASGAIRLPDPVVTRVLALLPFFVVGLHLTEDRVRLLRTRPARIAAVLVFAAATAAAALAVRHVDPEWVHYRRPDGGFAVSPPALPAARSAALACGLALSAAFLALVPARRTWFTGLGAASMYVYLLHGFVVLGATYAGWYAPVRELGPVGGPALVTALGVALALLTAAPPVRRAFRWAVEPHLDRAFRGRPVSAPRELAVAAHGRAGRRRAGR